MLQSFRVLDFVLEHEMMHHETLLYMLQQLPDSIKTLRPAPAPFSEALGCVPARDMVFVRGAAVQLGTALGRPRFGWDIEFPKTSVTVSDLLVDRTPVSCGQFAEFVADGGFARAELWDPDDWAWVQREGIAAPATWRRTATGWEVLTVHGAAPLVPGAAADWPVYVCHAMARAYTSWRAAREHNPLLRLATEAELHRIVYPPEQAGELSPGNYGWRHWAPTPTGQYPANALGLVDTLGNGWELSATVFAGLPGFARVLPTYPGYSADFFDGKHYAVVGASYGTDAALVRPSFRNWYQGRYPHPHLKFRCVRDAPA
jgi:formylglycine-generating enzyme required for sulfatase activity